RALPGSLHMLAREARVEERLDDVAERRLGSELLPHEVVAAPDREPGARDHRGGARHEAWSLWTGTRAPSASSSALHSRPRPTPAGRAPAASRNTFSSRIAFTRGHCAPSARARTISATTSIGLPGRGCSSQSGGSSHSACFSVSWPT